MSAEQGQPTGPTLELLGQGRDSSSWCPAPLEARSRATQSPWTPALLGLGSRLHLAWHCGARRPGPCLGNGPLNGCLPPRPDAQMGAFVSRYGSAAQERSGVVRACGAPWVGALGGGGQDQRRRQPSVISETMFWGQNGQDVSRDPCWGRKPLANKGVPAPKGLPEMRRGRRCCNPASHRSRKPAVCRRQGMGGSGPARAQKGPRLSGGRAVGTGAGGRPGRSPVSSPT